MTRRELMRVKASLGDALKEKGKSQTAFAKEVGYDQSTISKWVTGSRTITKEARPILARAVDSFKYYTTLIKETTGIGFAPYMDGKKIKRDVASLRVLVEQEQRDTMEFWDKDFWYVPANSANEREIQEARRFVQEYSEKLAIEFNLLGAFCEQYRFSLKEVDQKRDLAFKTRGFVK
ncbi:hypothetical protein A4R27_21905 [Priestia endophytica]|nr:hypothetical protein A4R27_21905 [Priestia endophytica]